MKFIEPKIGDVFIFRGFKLKCVVQDDDFHVVVYRGFKPKCVVQDDDTHCSKCFLHDKGYIGCDKLHCCWDERKDNKDVSFELWEMPPKPLFIPLKTEWFEKFASGEKTIEYRRYGARWNMVTCCPGRNVVLSKGYGESSRLRGVVKSSRVVKNPPDYVRKIYPVGEIFAIEIEVER